MRLRGRKARAIEDGAVSVLRLYKRVFSPLLPRACRFTPSCSEYGALAIGEGGLVRGSIKTIGRLLRCHPLHPGGVDLP